MLIFTIFVVSSERGGEVPVGARGSWEMSLGLGIYGDTF
jgi:hypothetical protein